MAKDTQSEFLSFGKEEATFNYSVSEKKNSRPIAEPDKESDPNLAPELPKVEKPNKVIFTPKVGRVTAGTALKMRAEPTTASPILHMLRRGASVTILSTESGWHKITFGDLTGYVMEQYVQ